MIIFTFQEIKCLDEEVPEEAKLKGYHPYWYSKPGGRSGVAIFSKVSDPKSMIRIVCN